MSEPQEPNAGPEPDAETTAPPVKGRREPQPGDVPKPIVWAVLTVAVLVSGVVGWKRYQALREETRQEMQAVRAAEQRRVAEELRRARKQREAEAEAAARSATGEGSSESKGTSDEDGT